VPVQVVLRIKLRLHLAGLRQSHFTNDYLCQIEEVKWVKLIFPVIFAVIFVVFFGMDLLGLKGIYKYSATCFLLFLVMLPIFKAEKLNKKIPLIWGVLLIALLFVVSILIPALML